MIELFQITNDPDFARRCDALPGLRLWVDLERLGKSERQAGQASFISSHALEDVGRIKSVLHSARLMVRVNPLNSNTSQEVNAVLAQGADLLMLPMFSAPHELDEFLRIVDGRVPVVPLLETAGALQTLPQWVGLPGLAEVFVGLNDLHLSLGCSFMFEPLVLGHIDRVASIARGKGLRFGFGGIARLDEGLLPGRDVLAEHVRLGSSAVILSRTFHRSDSQTSFESEVSALRHAEQQLAGAPARQIEADRSRIHGRIAEIAASQRFKVASA